MLSAEPGERVGLSFNPYHGFVLPLNYPGDHSASFSNFKKSSTEILACRKISLKSQRGTSLLWRGTVVCLV